MRSFKGIKTLRFLTALCMINGILSFLLEPVDGYSGTVWKQYYAQEELDTVFIGSSFAAHTFHPYILDEALGVKSFNMGTPMQALNQTIGALETILKEHPIDTVIYGMGFYSLQVDPSAQPEIIFEKAKARGKEGLAGVIEGIEYILSDGVIDTEKSVHYFFPWLYNHTEINAKEIYKNAAAKVEALRNPQNMEEVFYKGYKRSAKELDYDTMWQSNSYLHYSQSFSEREVKEFENLLKLCNEKQVDLIVVNTPHPAFDVVSCYETYAQNDRRVSEICEKYGVDYYDFSLVKPEIFKPLPTYYTDFEHLNEEGAAAFAQAFGDFLTRRARKEEMDDYFYTVEEFLGMQEKLLEEWKLVQ